MDSVRQITQPFSFIDDLFVIGTTGGLIQLQSPRVKLRNTLVFNFVDSLIDLLFDLLIDLLIDVCCQFVVSCCDQQFLRIATYRENKMRTLAG